MGPSISSLAFSPYPLPSPPLLLLVLLCFCPPLLSCVPSLCSVLFPSLPFWLFGSLPLSPYAFMLPCLAVPLLTFLSAPLLRCLPAACFSASLHSCLSAFVLSWPSAFLPQSLLRFLPFILGPTYYTDSHQKCSKTQKAQNSDPEWASPTAKALDLHEFACPIRWDPFQNTTGRRPSNYHTSPCKQFEKAFKLTHP